MNTVFRSIPFVILVLSVLSLPLLSVRLLATETVEAEHGQEQAEEKSTIHTEPGDVVEKGQSESQADLAKDEPAPAEGEQRPWVEQPQDVEEKSGPVEEAPLIKQSVFGRRSVFEQELMIEKEEEEAKEDQLSGVENRLALVEKEVSQLKEKTHFLEDQLRRSRKHKKKDRGDSLRYGWTEDEVLTSIGAPWKTYGYVKDGKQFAQWLYSEFAWHRYQNVLFEDGHVVGWNLPDSVQRQLEKEAAVEFLEKVEE